MTGLAHRLEMRNPGNRYDVAVVGGGPAGAACATLCAAGGLKTLLLERANFPREKVCGDCVNPSAWPVLERLGVAERVRTLPHSRLEFVEFIGLDGRHVRFPFPSSERGEIAVKRSAFDAVLFQRAREAGVDVREGHAVTAIAPGWTLHAADAAFAADRLVAADGRNSTVARLLGLLPSAARDRVAVQTHLPAPADFGHGVVLRFHRHGYSGLASIGDCELNLCLVARPQHLDELKARAAQRFALAADVAWRTVTPLARGAVAAVQPNLLLVGDAARVVEPFTGEGITYALATGALAADHLLGGDLAGYRAAHRALYRGRLWINQLARLACLHPQLASLLLRQPRALRYLTRKVIG